MALSGLARNVQPTEGRVTVESVSIGESFQSGTLEKLAKEDEAYKGVLEWSRRFKHTLRDQKGRLHFSFYEGTNLYVIVAGHDGDKTPCLKFYRVEDGLIKHSIHTETLECHVECMMFEFLVTSYSHYTALQSIIRGTKPNPNSPWARH